MKLGLGLGLQYLKGVVGGAISFVTQIIESLQSRGTTVENIAGTTAELEQLETDGLLSKASILVTPTSLSTGIIHSAIPINGDCDLDVVRNSTATRINELGLIEEVGINVPRLDYTDPLNPSWLAEPQATNLIKYSKGSGPTWTTGTQPDLVLPNLEPSIFSGLESTKYTNTSNNSSSFLYYAALTVTSGETYTLTGYIKLDTATNALVVINDTTTWHSMQAYNFEATSAGGYNEWKKFKITFIAPTNNRINIHVGYHQRNDLTPQSLGSFLLGGIQVVLGDRELSLIPTNGTSLTRNADVINKTGISAYLNPSDIILFMEMKPVSDIALQSQRSIQIEGTGGNGNNEILLQYLTSGIRVVVYTNGALILNKSVVLDLSIYNKMAVKKSSSNMSIFINGVKVYNQDGTFGDIIGANGFNFNRSGTNNLEARVKIAGVWSGLTDAELITLTT